MEKTVAYYLSLPYTIELKHDAEDGWFVRVKELPGCMSQGDTVDEAMAMIQEAMHGWLTVALEQNITIPEPQREEEFSGKFVVRMPRSLHRDLVQRAQQEGVSLNQYVNVALGQVVGQSVAIAPRKTRRQSPAATPP
ncbi:type II toxin-antitoxin system HicB family antitoxin [Candidatus Amarolinea aalborgensis]|jgi:antitoxin HicB|uniref:type II toxin-antitoxin system HicB family antitoxin n=1 Tax=Candidatus Amarolinea aalborgensis TaxID=2249329 RepID=UPI003BFA23C3